MPRPLILGVGLSKTGTSSLHQALHLLGYRSLHNPMSILRLGAEDTGLVVDVAEALRYDALSDLPVAYAYPQLDAIAPDTKFVITTRDEDSWLRSAANHFFEPSPHASERYLVRTIYGAEAFDRVLFSRGYRAHYARLDKYLVGREADVLRLDLADEDKFERLCAFLGEPMPDVAYPNMNAASAAPAWLKRMVRSNDHLLEITRRTRNKFNALINKT